MKPFAKREAFRQAFLILKRRIELFASLPLDKLSLLSLQEGYGRSAASKPVTLQALRNIDVGVIER